MKRVILHGCGGRMGLAVQNELKDNPDLKLVAGIDKICLETASFPVFSSLQECDVEADVVIDFSNASVTDALLDSCEQKGLALVLCTTGLSKEQLKHVERTALFVPVLKSANMSLGVNIVQRLVSEAARLLYSEGFDIEIIEKHHRMKTDAPSGTAFMLADTINESLENSLDYNLDRSKTRDRRNKSEIGISAVRGGGIVGEHEVIFAGDNELVSVKHEAFSRGVFATGAVLAAAYLVGRKPGLYNMQDVISQ